MMTRIVPPIVLPFQRKEVCGIIEHFGAVESRANRKNLDRGNLMLAKIKTPWIPFVVFAVVVGLAWCAVRAASPATQPVTPAAKVLRAERIELVDREGNVRMRLEVSRDGPEVWMIGADGKISLAICHTDKHNCAYIGLGASEGNNLMLTRSTIEATTDGRVRASFP